MAKKKSAAPDSRAIEAKVWQLAEPLAERAGADADQTVGKFNAFQFSAAFEGTVADAEQPVGQFKRF